MADAEARLHGEIARLEAELERARLESKLQHLRAELNNVEGVLNYDEYMVIQELIDDTGEGEYDEYIEESYDEYDEEEYEEEDYEDEIVEDEEEVEYEIEEDICGEDVPEQAPTRRVYGDLQNAHENLRKAPVSPYHRKETEAAVAVQPAVVHNAVPAAKVVKPQEAKLKSKVRPPPGQGGTPLPRKDPEAKVKPGRKNPLSRLLQRSQKSIAIGPAQTAPPAREISAPKKVIPTKAAPRNPVVPKKLAQTSGDAPKKKGVSTVNGPFKRRIIPNLQPSPAGEETIFEQLLGPKLITNPQLHKSSTKGCMNDQELVGLYFGAEWKSDCKRFNSILKDFYYNTAQQNNLEIVYISADRSLLEFKDCYATMPFLAMPAGTTAMKNELTKSLKIIEMPALVILDDEGNVVTVQGLQKIQELEKGNVEQANQLVDRWTKTRPIPISKVKLDNTLLHGTIERGTVYWHS